MSTFRFQSTSLARKHVASSPGLQLCGGKAWYRLHAHAHARAFCKICRIRIRTDIVGLFVYGQFYGKVYGNIAHTHAVDTRPSLRIIEGLGTRLGNMQLHYNIMYCRLVQLFPRLVD